MKHKIIKQEYTTSSYISDSNKKNASNFVIQAKKIARSMATNYNIKKKSFEAASTSYQQNGTLDISRIHSYRTSDDIFTRKVIHKEGKSHGIVCSLDFSISMRRLIPSVAMQFLITSLFCKYINIEFRFFTFTTDQMQSSHNKKYNHFRLGNSSSREYARFVDIGNQTMSEKQLIEAFYHILSFVETDDSQFSKEYTAYLKNTFKTMNCTPLLAAVYQSYLVAKDMQSRGIQNINILTINDGDNNCYFINNSDDGYSTDSPDQLSIEDPFTRRIYDVNPKNVSGRNGMLSAINKMIRDNGIKSFNMFLDTNININDVGMVTTSYLKSTDIPMSNLPNDVLDKLFNDVKKTGRAEVKNLCFYDSVILVDSKIFPNLSRDSISGHDASKSTYLAERSANIKKLGALGTFLSDAMVADFKLSK